MTIPLTVLRQSAAEVLASVVVELFPGTLLAGSTVTEIGFHYDFQLDQPIDDHMLILIEEKMRAAAKSAEPVQAMDMMRENAADLFLHYKQPIIADFVRSCPKNIIQIFKMGRFHDFCPAPYVQNSKEIGAFKLLKVSSIENGVRIEGTAFADNYDLKKFLKKAEAAKKCDHRILGPEMGLFTSSNEIAPGCWIWLPKGAFLRGSLINLWRKEIRSQGFQMVSSPLLVKESLLKKVGLAPEGNPSLFDARMTPKIELLHALAYQAKSHTYRDLPVKYAEIKEVLSDEPVQKLWGMFRARTFTPDIENIFCAPQEVMQEIISSLQFIAKTINMFGFEHHWYLSIKGKKSGGSKEQWETNIDKMKKALETCELEYTVDSESNPYDGPQIEVRLIDALGREWKGSHVGINFTYPERLGLRYRDADDHLQATVMITRSVFGSVERFIALLVEHCAGQIPFWLAPEQVRVIPVGDHNVEYAEAVRQRITKEGWRVGIDYRKEALGNKVHAAECEKVPYMLIVGDKEEKSGSINVRSYAQEAVKGGTQIETFLAQLKEESTQLRSTKSVES